MNPQTSNFGSDSEKQAGGDADAIQESRIATSAEECNTELGTKVELTVRLTLNSSICFLSVSYTA